MSSLAKQKQEKQMNGYLLSFGVCAAAAFFIFLPFLVVDKGLFQYCGDFNSQQIPFYTYMNGFVKNSAGQWSWETDLGTSAVNSYSFYLYGSPFFWLTTLLPQAWVPFSMVPMFMLKFGVAGLGAYTYLKRYSAGRNYAVIGACLYALSGFTVYNTFFNHFVDCIALFPFLLWALGMLACVSLSAFAAEYGEPNITTKTTMKELRENPSIKGSGYYTYCNEWIEGSTQYDDTPIEGYVSYAAAEDAAEGMNLVIENYNRGVQITWQVYTPEEIAENSSLGMVQLYYFPAKTANAKYAIVVPGNGGNTTAELNEGASIANQLHELGYAAFVLRYRSFLNASDNAPLYDIANAVKYLTENADQFGVQRENYALMGFSSGGHIVGLIGSDNEKFGYKAFGLPQPAALLLGYPINDFFEVKPLYQLAIDPLVLGWRYYWTDISDVVNENFTPTYFFYGKNDLYMQRMCYSQQGPLLERKLRESGAVYECHVYENAPHAIGPGRHTDADGWIRQATAFWEKQCK